MPTPLLLDGTDLESLGCVVESWTGDLVPALDRPPSTAVASRFGERATGAAAVVPPRSLSVKLTIRATSASAAQTVRDAVIALASGTASGTTAGAVVAIFGSAPTKQFTVYLANATSAEWMAGHLAPGVIGATLTLTFTALDPLAYDTTDTTHALSTTIARCAVGTAPSWPVVTLDGGSWTSRVVTLKDGADVTVASFTITKPSGTAGTGHTVEIDCAAESVVRIDGSGNRTAQNAWLTAGDFLALDPLDVVSSTNPGLVLSAGTGGVTYRRAWR